MNSDTNSNRDAVSAWINHMLVPKPVPPTQINIQSWKKRCFDCQIPCLLTIGKTEGASFLKC